jgi:hypothetical protein
MSQLGRCLPVVPKTIIVRFVPNTPRLPRVSMTQRQIIATASSCFAFYATGSQLAYTFPLVRHKLTPVIRELYFTCDIRSQSTPRCFAKRTDAFAETVESPARAQVQSQRHMAMSFITISSSRQENRTRCPVRLVRYKPRVRTKMIHLIEGMSSPTKRRGQSLLCWTRWQNSEKFSARCQEQFLVEEGQSRLVAPLTILKPPGETLGPYWHGGTRVS